MHSGLDSCEFTEQFAQAAGNIYGVKLKVSPYQLPFARLILHIFLACAAADG